jgi:hypothetical protein
MYKVPVFNHHFGYWVKQLYGCQAGSLALTEAQIFNTFETKMPRRILEREGNRERQTAEEEVI